MSLNIETSDDVLAIVYQYANDINFEIKDNAVWFLKEQNHPVQKFLRKLRINIPQYSKMELDEKSSFVFKRIDGIKTVKEIGELVAIEFSEEEYVYETLLLFLNHLEFNEKCIHKINI